MMRWIKFLIFFISLLFLPTRFNRLTGCGGGWDAYITDVSLFRFNTESFDTLSAFLPEAQSLYEVSGINEEQLNTNEWMVYFNNKISYDSLQTLIYNSTAAEIEALLKNKKAKKQREALNYILMLRDSAAKAKKDLYDYSWSYKPKGDSVDFVAPIEKAKKQFFKTKDEFLKIRYGYLVLRLLRFSLNYTECIKWYETNFLPLNPTGTIKYRGLQYYAGSLYNTSEFARANYYFSRIFDEYPARASQAVLDFSPFDEMDWQQSLKLAKNNHEKEVLYFLYAFNNPLDAIKEIYKLNPGSEFNPILLVRLVQSIEVNLREISSVGIGNSYYFYNNYANSDNEPYTYIGGSERAKNPDMRMQACLFLSSICDDTALNRQCMWTSAAAYLNLLLKNYEYANKLIEKATKQSDGKADMEDELKILNAIYKVKTTSILDVKTEEEIYREVLYKNADISDNSYSEKVRKYVLQLLSKKYEMQGDILKAELCTQTTHLYYSTETLERVKAMRDFIERKDLRPFEQFLINNYAFKRNDMIEAQATVKLYQNDLDGALKIFNQDSTSGGDELYGNPFTIRINDCHDCDHNALQPIKYTKLSFLKKMVEMKSIAEKSKNANEKSTNYFLVANGLYNMTYFGNARVVANNFLSRFSGDSYNNYYPSYKENNEPLFYNEFDELYNDCSAAEKFYRLGYDASKDKEFKAKCIWMIAKCQLNMFYQTKDYMPGKIDFYASAAYDVLKTEFSDTKYYKEILNQCEYFNDYAKK